MAVFGRLWSEIAADLKLDPENRIARALATRETWSGIVVSWPVDDSDERLPVELSGLPVFDRDRSFRGYRGFGVCRDIDGINALARARHERPTGFVPAPDPAPAENAVPAPPVLPPMAAAAAEPSEAVEAAPPPDRPATGIPLAAANVVPFRQSPPAEPKPAETKAAESKPAETRPAENGPAEPKPAPTLTPVERRAFRELAQELTARLRAPFEAPSAQPRVKPKRLNLPRRRPPPRRPTNMCCSIAYRSAFWCIATMRCSLPIAIFSNGAAMRISPRSRPQAVSTAVRRARRRRARGSRRRAVAFDPDANWRRARGRGPPVHRALERIARPWR